MSEAKQTSYEVMLSIQGMNTITCATRIENLLSKEDSIDYIAVSYPLKTAYIQVRKQISVEPYLKKIKSLGFHAKLMSSVIEDIQHEKRGLGLRFTLSLLLTIPLLLPKLLSLDYLSSLSLIQYVPPLFFSPIVQLICATIIQFLLASSFYIKAYYAIREKIVNMDVLALLATTITYFYSHFELFQHSLSEIIHIPLHVLEGLYFETTGVVITAVLFGKYIELMTAIKLQRDYPLETISIDTRRAIIKGTQLKYSKLQQYINLVMYWAVPFIITLSIIALLFGLIDSTRSNQLNAFISALIIVSPNIVGTIMPNTIHLLSILFLKKGLLIKDASAIERLAQINQIKFNSSRKNAVKEMKVSFFHNWKGNRKDILKYMTALEASLENPLALAIKRYSQLQPGQLPKVSLWHYYIEKGVGGYIDKKHIILGNEQLLQHVGLELSFIAKRIAEERLERGETILFMFEERELVAIIGFTDKGKQTISSTLEELKRLDIQTIVAESNKLTLSTGLVRKIGLHSPSIRKFPKQTLTILTQLHQNRVEMLVVDERVSELIHTGAILNVESDEQRELEGSLSLIYGDLKELPYAIKASRVALKLMEQNLIFLFIYAIVMLPIAMAGYLEPWLSALFMLFSVIVVNGNSYRLMAKLDKLKYKGG